MVNIGPAAQHNMREVLRFKVATLIAEEEEEILQFNKLIDDFFRDENIPQLVKGLKILIRKPARLQLFDDVRRVVPLRMQMEYNLQVPYTSNRIRTVRLLRRSPPPSGFGFSIRGGREHGTGFFVSAVEHGSEAHQQGLRVGDQIVGINGFPVEDAIHHEVTKIIQNYNHLNLRVRSVGMIPVKDNDFVLMDDDYPEIGKPSLSRNASEPGDLVYPYSSSSNSSRRTSIESYSERRKPPAIGNIGRSASATSITSNKKHDPLTWRMVDGNDSMGRSIKRTPSEASMIEGPSTYDEARDVKLFLDATNHPALGIKISSGSDQKLGIFVTHVYEGGLAWEAGLARGDQILECNGVNFEDIEFKKAQEEMKQSKHLDLLIRKGTGFETFGESSGYNSSSSSVNGDHSPRDAGKRLSLITEDPREDGERSRSNSRRDQDEAVTIITQSMSRTVITSDTVDSTRQEQRVQVSAQVHREENGHHELERSSSGSSVSSLSSGVSHEAKRRSERRDEEQRRRREIALKVVPEERRLKHATLMQEFQEAHRRMFAESEKQHRSASRERYESHNGHHDTYTAVQNGKPRPAPLSISEAEAVTLALSDQSSRRSAEMASIDNMTLSSPQSAKKPKPPATYFGGGKTSNKSQPGVVTISEYPTDRRSSPSKLDFIGNGHGHPVHDDPQSALASELQNTLSRSNLRQLSEPVAAPPPPPMRRSPSPPPMSPIAHERPMSPIEPDAVKKAQQKPVQYRRMISSPPPPPVIALKPLAVPYTELVTQKNQQNFSAHYVESLQSSTPPASPARPLSPPVTSPPPPVQNYIIPQPPSTPVQKTKPAPTPLSATHHRDIMDALANKVTIKFPNGESASAGNKSLNHLMATAPQQQGILKNGKAKHKTVIHQKSITFGEITTVMCVQVQD